MRKAQQIGGCGNGRGLTRSLAVDLREIGSYVALETELCPGTTVAGYRYCAVSDRQRKIIAQK